MLLICLSAGGPRAGRIMSTRAVGTTPWQVKGLTLYMQFYAFMEVTIHPSEDKMHYVVNLKIIMKKAVILVKELNTVLLPMSHCKPLQTVLSPPVHKRSSSGAWSTNALRVDPPHWWILCRASLIWASVTSQRSSVSHPREHLTAVEDDPSHAILTYVPCMHWTNSLLFVKDKLNYSTMPHDWSRRKANSLGSRA